MKKMLLALFGFALLSSAAIAGGKNEKVVIKFDDAVKNYQDKKGQQLDGSVKFYWAGEKAPAKGGEELSAKGSTMQRGTQEERCAKALAAALITFQERAKSEGMNAVVGVTTYYDATTKSGDRNQCLCAGGRMLTHTTVKGHLAKIGK